MYPVCPSAISGYVSLHPNSLKYQLTKPGTKSLRLLVVTNPANFSALWPSWFVIKGRIWHPSNLDGWLCSGIEYMSTGDIHKSILCVPVFVIIKINLALHLCSSNDDYGLICHIRCCFLASIKKTPGGQSMTNSVGDYRSPTDKCAGRQGCVNSSNLYL